MEWQCFQHTNIYVIRLIKIIVNGLCHRFKSFIVHTRITICSPLKSVFFLSLYVINNILAMHRTLHQLLLFLRNMMYYTSISCNLIENYWIWHSWSVNFSLLYRFNCFTFSSYLYSKTINSYYCFELLTKNNLSAIAFIYVRYVDLFSALILNGGLEMNV